MALHTGLQALHMAVHQVASVGTAEQKATVEALLGDARRRVYLVLAEPGSTPAETGPGSQAAAPGPSDPG